MPARDSRRAGALAPALTCTFSGGGGVIHALATTDSPVVPVETVLMLAQESAV